MEVLLAVEIIAAVRLGGALDPELDDSANGFGRRSSGAADRLRRVDGIELMLLLGSGRNSEAKSRR